MVIAIQTFGDYLNYHPHLHILITDGAFVGSHTFHALHRGDWEQVAELPFASFLDGIVYDGEWGDTSGSPSEHDARRQDLDESQETSFQYDFDQRPPPQWEEDQW
ncbi:MAG: transposase, partial [Verrucomicrobiia bacterium]